MKILLLMDNPSIATGYASTCRLTAKELVKRGHEVYAVAFNGNYHSGVVDWQGIKILPNDALKRDGGAGYGDAEMIVKIHHELNPDIFFFHCDSYRYRYIERLPEDVLSKSIFWLPFEGTEPDRLGVHLFSKMAATRFVTDYALKFHESFLRGKDIGYIPHAVDLDILKPCADKRAAKASKTAKFKQSSDARTSKIDISNKFVVTRVDRNQPRKKYQHTLEAFAKFARGKDDVLLMCKCHPRDIAVFDHQSNKGLDLELLADELGIRDKVFFDDYFFRPDEMCEAFFDVADVFLTTTSGEGFGLGVVEAMACSIPIICPKVPVMPEVVADGGILCKVAGTEYHAPLHVTHNVVDTDDVASKLEWAYNDWKKNDGAELRKLGEAGRKRVEENYSPTVVYDQWDRVFTSVAERRDLVSIVTVLWNVDQDQIGGENGVARLAASLKENVRQPYEWIIVDNGSPLREETRAWMMSAAAENPRIKVRFLDNNRGFAGANNIGISCSTGKYVLFLNPDCEALNPASLGKTDDFVAQMLNAAKADPNVGVVGTDLHKRDDVLSGSEFPYFCCALVTRRCLDEVQLGEHAWFDENFWPAYYEDCDFCFRALGKNLKVIGVDAPIWHKSGGTNSYCVKGGLYAEHLRTALETISSKEPSMADFGRKRGELALGGMKGLIDGNIAYLNSKWGAQARAKIKVVWSTKIGDAVGFSAIAEGLIPELHHMGFDVYVNDWNNAAKVEDPLIRSLILKTRTAIENGEDLSQAINIVCWLMESFASVDADFKVGTAFCESTRIRPGYLPFVNPMDRILTFSDFCRKVQKDSGFTSKIDTITPGVHKTFLNYHERPRRDKFTFLSVGVSQERKDTRRLVQAFCEAFPLSSEYPPEAPNFPYKCKDVQLIVKSNNFGELGWISAEGFDKRANVVALFTGDERGAVRQNLSTQEMYDLYCQADCLVHPSHGEGIGMPILEGAATGLPVIYTNWSSPTEYLDDKVAYPISLSPYPNTTFTTAYLGHGNVPGENGQWANMHVGHLKFLMYTVIRKNGEARAKGKKAAERMASRFNWNQSARLLAPLLFEWEAERKKKDPKASFDPMTFVKPPMEPVQQGDRVMIDICTRDRHQYLATLLVSLLNQTYKNWDVVIQVDDADDSMPYDYQIKSILSRLSHEGHGWGLIRSYKQGPHIAHDRSLQMTLNDQRYKYKLICRIDDDIYVRPDYLENMVKVFAEDPECEVGGVGGVYLDPKKPDAEQLAPPNFEKDIFYAGLINPNVMNPFACLYPEGTPPRRVEHLYSSFMYRTEVAKAIGGYCRLFSQIGFREESDFSYRFHLAGFKLFIQPKSIGYHFCAPAGGVRADAIVDRQRLAMGDEKIYQRRLKYWRQRAAEKAGELSPVERGKILVALGGENPELLSKAIERYSKYGEVYVSSKNPEAKGLKAAMVATTDEEVALMTKAMLSEGDHEYIMSVTEDMEFLGDPRSLLSPDYDDYVFEVFETYVAPRPIVDENGATSYVVDSKPVIGPELENQCLIYRRRPNSRPVIERTLYSDMYVLRDRKRLPVDGKSRLGNELVRVEDMCRVSWTKVCTYQFPEGRIDPPERFDVSPPKYLVSIIIPTAGRKLWLKKCLDSIYANTTTSFEIIIVDNGSSDGTMEYLQRESSLRNNLRVFRQQVNLGYQKAINIGVANARGEYLLLFNDDAWVIGREYDGRDWLGVYVDKLRANPKIGLVGPHECISPALQKPMLFFWCVMMRRSLWDEVGPLDDVTFLNYGGDDDYCERVRQKGYEIVAKPTRLGHSMVLVPEEQKKPQLKESEIKLKAKWGIA